MSSKNAPKTAPQKNGDGPVTLLAWRAPLKNRTLLIAYRPDTDPNDPTQLVTVRVRSNVHFLPGMRLQARASGVGQYDLEGPLPRWRGRW